MAKKKAAPKVALKSDADAQKALEASPADPSPSMSKMDMVREALAKGIEKGADIVAYVKTTHGIDIPAQMAATYKSNIKKKDAGGKSGPKPAVMVPSSPGPKRTASGEVELLNAMEAMKPLVATLGADKVKRIVDLLG